MYKYPSSYPNNVFAAWIGDQFSRFGLSNSHIMTKFIYC